MEDQDEPTLTSPCPTFDPFFLKVQTGQLISLLYTNVTNMSEFKKFVLQAGLPVCLLKPKFILDEFQLKVGIIKASSNFQEKVMKTKTFPAELIYWLSPFRNINESLKTFGVDEKDSEVIIVGEPSILEETIKPMINGQEIPFSHLGKYSDPGAIQALFGISDDELKESTLSSSIISRVSTKDYV